MACSLRILKRPPISWEVSCGFRLRCSLRGLGAPPSVVRAPDKELNNDDVEGDGPHSQNGTTDRPTGQVLER